MKDVEGDGRRIGRVQVGPGAGGGGRLRGVGPRRGGLQSHRLPGDGRAGTLVGGGLERLAAAAYGGHGAEGGLVPTAGHRARPRPSGQGGAGPRGHGHEGARQRQRSYESEHRDMNSRGPPGFRQTDRRGGLPGGGLAAATPGRRVERAVGVAPGSPRSSGLFLYNLPTATARARTGRRS